MSMKRWAMMTALALSCSKPAATPPAAKHDLSAAHKEVWALVPADADVAGSLARLDHVIERLTALRAAASTGPETKKWLDTNLAKATAALGFDPLDSAGWRAQGLDTAAPIAFFLEGKDGRVLFKATGGKTPADFAKKLGATCDAAGAFIACGDAGAHPAADGKSLWARAEKESGGATADELFVFGPLDTPRVAKAMSFAPFFAASKSAWTSLDLGGGEIRWRLGYNNPQSGALRKYVQPDPGSKSLLGVAAGAGGASRITFSPKALWQLAEEKLGRKMLDTGLGAIQAATGIDFEKDVIDNLSGELVGVFHADSEGAQLLGTRDDARTQALLRRLDGVFVGALAGDTPLLQQAKLKITRSEDKAGGRPVYVYRLEAASDSELGFSSFELHLTTAPGALVIGIGKKGRDRALANIGNPPARFLDAVDPDVRQSFTDAAMVGWSKWGDYSHVWTPEQWAAVSKVYAKVSPDLPGILKESMALFELVYDASFRFDMSEAAMGLEYRIRLL
jgi:hypothetical protein